MIRCSLKTIKKAITFSKCTRQDVKYKANKNDNLINHCNAVDTFLYTYCCSLFHAIPTFLSVMKESCDSNKPYRVELSIEKMHIEHKKYHE